MVEILNKVIKKKTFEDLNNCECYESKEIRDTKFIF